MFAPRPELAAAELIRVCRPGGRIVMGNWTPEGFIGQMFQIVSQYVPPSSLIESPIRWGQEDIVRQRLHAGVADLKLTRRTYRFHYPFSPFNVVEYYREYFGPINCAFGALDEEARKGLHHDLEQLWKQHNVATNGDTTVDAEILEVIAVIESTRS
jgi:SAM-dependent methyltransferase